MSQDMRGQMLHIIRLDILTSLHCCQRLTGTIEGKSATWTDAKTHGWMTAGSTHNPQEIVLDLRLPSDLTDDLLQCNNVISRDDGVYGFEWLFAFETVQNACYGEKRMKGERNRVTIQVRKVSTVAERSRRKEM
jgi:hypothetical protein